MEVSEDLFGQFIDKVGFLRGGERVEVAVDGTFKLLDTSPEVKKRHEKDHLDDTEVGEE